MLIEAVFLGLCMVTSAEAECPTDGPSLSPRSPPVQCALARGAFCIASTRHDMVLEEQEFGGGEKIIQFYEPLWSDFPAVVIYSSDCISIISDRQEMVGSRFRSQLRGRTWDTVDIQLSSSGSCRVRLMAPVRADDDLGYAYTALVGIRVCDRSACPGRSIGTLFPALIERP